MLGEQVREAVGTAASTCSLLSFCDAHIARRCSPVHVQGNHVEADRLCAAALAIDEMDVHLDIRDVSTRPRYQTRDLHKQVGSGRFRVYQQIFRRPRRICCAEL